MTRPKNHGSASSTKLRLEEAESIMSPHIHVGHKSVTVVDQAKQPCHPIPSPSSRLIVAVPQTAAATTSITVTPHYAASKARKRNPDIDISTTNTTPNGKASVYKFDP